MLNIVIHNIEFISARKPLDTVGCYSLSYLYDVFPWIENNLKRPPRQRESICYEGMTIVSLCIEI